MEKGTIMGIKTFKQKLFAFQEKVEAITKDSKNPFFKSSYFDINTLIAEVKPTLCEVGLILLQPLTMVDGKMAIKTIIMDADGEENMESVVLLPENTDPQKVGSGITYMRRYAIQSMLLLQAEDDDGNSAAHRSAPQATKKEFVLSNDANAVRKTCVDCGREYNPKPGTEAYSTKCFDCFKKNGTKSTKIIKEDLPTIQVEEPPLPDQPF